MWPHGVAFLSMLNPTHGSVLVFSEVKAVFLLQAEAGSKAIMSCRRVCLPTFLLNKTIKGDFGRNGQKRCVRDTSP